MIVYEPPIGTDIHSAAFDMVLLAVSEQDVVKAVFNGIELSTDPKTIDPSIDVFSAAKHIVDDFMLKRDIRDKEYRESPEGKSRQNEFAMRLRHNQKTVNAAVAELETLDFSDIAAVVDWFDKVTDPMDFRGVKVPSAKIVRIFKINGYLPCVNTGNNYNDEDKENFARYIIGQALLGLKSPIGRIHPVFKSFAKKWREKFIPN